MTNMATTIRASVSVTDFNSGTTGPAIATPSLSIASELADGIGADQADVFWSDTRTIAASGSDALDLTGGGLLNGLRVAANFAKVKAIFVSVPSSAPALGVSLTPGTNGVANLFGGTSQLLRILPGGSVLLANPTATGIVSVTAGTADILTVTNPNGGAAVTYSIMIVGTSA